MSDEGRYSIVSRRVWGDENFSALSAAKPNAQTLWLRLLTGPELGPVPGLFAARERGLADALGWPDAAFRKCWKEIADRKMAAADWVAGIVWVPKSLDHNPPHSCNVVLSWKVSLKELPESKLKAHAMATIQAKLVSMGEPWAKAWAKASGQPWPLPSGMQEHSASDLPSGIPDSLPSPDPDLPESFSRPRARGERPRRKPTLLVVRVDVGSYGPLPEHADYADELGVSADQARAALLDLRDKFGGKRHDVLWLDEKYCSFLEQVARSNQAGPRRNGAPESPSDRRVREQLEHAARLEREEAAQ